MESILDRPLIRIRQYADLTDESPAAVYLRIQKGTQPGVVRLPGGSYRIRTSILRDLLQEPENPAKIEAVHA